jgi:hypothetical protein
MYSCARAPMLQRVEYKKIARRPKKSSLEFERPSDQNLDSGEHSLGA